MTKCVELPIVLQLLYTIVKIQGLSTFKSLKATINSVKVAKNCKSVGLSFPLMEYSALSLPFLAPTQKIAEREDATEYVVVYM